MLNKLKTSLKSKGKVSSDTGPPAGDPGGDVASSASTSGEGDGVSEEEVHDYLDCAKYRRWADVERWLSANPRRPAHVNDTPCGRWSALHQAALNGSVETCTLLLRYGADPSAKNPDGDTPADVAMSRGVDEPSLISSLEKAAEEWNAGRRRETLFGLLSIDPVNDRGSYCEDAVVAALSADPGAAQMRYAFVRYGLPMYPLFPAVRLGASAGLVSALCDAHPPSLEEKTQNGWTLLHEACRWGAPLDTMNLILSKLPKAAGSTNIYGQSPLHLACKYPVLPEAIQLVAEAHPGAWHVKDSKGKTPILLLEECGGAPEVLHQIAKTSGSSEFYAKLMEEDDRNINFKISELVPLIEDVHNARFFYTLVNSAYKSGGITLDDRVRYVREGLRVASSTTTCTDSIAVFKLLLRKASDDGALADLEREKLDREAEVVHTSNAPFVRELWEHVQSNAARIEGLERSADALIQSVEKLKAGIRYQKRVEAAVGLAGAVLNAVSLGFAGSALSAATNAAIGSIVDFGDVSHIGAVIQSVGDASVKDAFELGLGAAEATANARLDRAIAESNPIVTIAFAAKVVDSGGTSVGDPQLQINEGTLSDLMSSEKLSLRLIDRVQFLEDQVLFEKGEASVSERISNLEVQVFGSTQEERGSLLRRVSHLEDELGVNQKAHSSFPILNNCS